MYFIGCDLGSTTGKTVVMTQNDGKMRIAGWSIVPSGLSPNETAALSIDVACERAGITREESSGICSTGYGRENVDSIEDNVSEITCHAKGAHFLQPTVRTIIDVGGQDVKAIALGRNGRVVDFAMNDKCAAGTGKFFEAMARTLRCSVQELGDMAMRSTNPVAISSTCSVFAESEVISYINKGMDRNEIAGGIHESIARRLFAMVNRVGHKTMSF